MRLHAGQVTEIDGVLKFGSSSIDARGHVVASTDKLVAVKTPERDTPLCLPRAGATLAGQLLALDDEGWTITLDGEKTAFQIPRDAVASVDISRGRHPGKDAGKGAVIGMLVGAAPCLIGDEGTVFRAKDAPSYSALWAWWAARSAVPCTPSTGRRPRCPTPQVALRPQLRHGVESLDRGLVLSGRESRGVGDTAFRNARAVPMEDSQGREGSFRTSSPGYRGRWGGPVRCWCPSGVQPGSPSACSPVLRSVGKEPEALGVASMCLGGL